MQFVMIGKILDATLCCEGSVLDLVTAYSSIGQRDSGLCWPGTSKVALDPLCYVRNFICNLSAQGSSSRVFIP